MQGILQTARSFFGIFLPFVLAPGVMVLAAASARAAPSGSVLVLAADEPTFYLDTQAKLQATLLFTQVDAIDARSSTPTLAQLQAYDAVITWSNYDYASSTTLGNLLADYVDAGGGVVVAVFTHCESNPSRELLGRWVTGNYPIVGPHAGILVNLGTPTTMGAVAQPMHPIMAGVTSFSGGSDSFRPQNTLLSSGSQLIASWSDGSVLVAEHGTIPGRVDLGFFPASSDALSSFWDASTDGARLMANALIHAGSSGSAPSFCAGDGTATACPCGNTGAAGHGCASSVSGMGGRLRTEGIARVSSDSLVLLGTSLPNSFALYFQGTSQLNGGLGLVFGDGLRCAAGQILRLGAKLNTNGASRFPAAGDASVSVKGAVTPGTRTYQVWYRNAAPFCTPLTFNLTNGVEVTWSP